MMRLLPLAAALATVAAVSLGNLSPVGGDDKFVNNNDLDWQQCPLDHAIAQTGVQIIGVEEADGSFVDHAAVLYKCDTSHDNPFFVRYKTGSRTTLLNLQWPTVLDENYLFQSRSPDDKDNIGYGFRVPVASETKKRFHYRKFFFNNLIDFNDFMTPVSKTKDAPSTHYAKADFFKAPQYDVVVTNLAVDPSNDYGDHYSGNMDVLEAFAHKGTVGQMLPTQSAAAKAAGPSAATVAPGPNTGLSNEVEYSK